jgi:ABC-type branched-subunit amino acid transport system substrate-binding protein
MTSLSRRSRMWRRIVGLGIVAVTLAAVACKRDEPVGLNVTPSFKKDGATLKCFDATATLVTFGAPWPLTTPTGPDANGVASVDGINMVPWEINQSCGIRVGSQKGERAQSEAGRPLGAPLAVSVRDDRNDAATSTTVTQSLIAAGVDALVAGGASGTGVPAAQVAVASNIPLGAMRSAADNMSGCTAAELADPTVTKSDTPVYAAGSCWNNHGLVFRTTATGFNWGTSGATYARTTYPTLTRAAIIYRDDDFGQPNRDGWVAQLGALGGTVLAQAGHVGAGGTVAVFRSQLIAITANNPSIIVGSIAGARLGFLMQAYVALRDDPTLWPAGTTKPANFNTLRFVWTSTLIGVDYSTAGPSAVAALVNQTDIVAPAWDPTSPTFQRWLGLYQSYAPSGQPPASGFPMGAYDAGMVMALAITAAGTTEPSAVAGQIRRVANPPGTVICPGQWQKAFRLLAKGKDINYEGALGPVDLDERGNATGLTFGIFRVLAGGATSAQVGGFGFPAHPVCTKDDEGDEEG